jgi:hypothetical protein
MLNAFWFWKGWYGTPRSKVVWPNALNGPETLLNLTSVAKATYKE